MLPHLRALVAVLAVGQIVGRLAGNLRRQRLVELARQQAQIGFEIPQRRGEVLQVIREQPAIAQLGDGRRIDRQQQVETKRACGNDRIRT